MQNQLQLLIRNALSNAVKYTSEGGQVTVSISATNSEILFCVTDNGPGIEEKYISRLGEPFYRPVEHATSKGASHGLATWHEIAVILNGVLTLKNMPRGGMQFLYKQTIAKPTS